MGWVGALLVGWWLVRFVHRAIGRVQSGEAAAQARHPVFDARRLRMLALAHPVASARVGIAFVQPEAVADPAPLERAVRPALLHLFKLRNDMGIDQIRAVLATQLRSRWFCLDLDKPVPGDDPRDAMAFACARVAFAVRAAAMLGWIDEQTQWDLLSQNAQRACDCFDSWSDYGAAWARGRRQWVGASRADSLGSAFDERQAEAWSADDRHPWGRLPWTVQPPFVAGVPLPDAA